MTLRLRLVVALVGLLAVGLAAFGFGTYSLYAASQYQRLDEQLRNSIAPVSRELEEAGSDAPSDDRDGDQGRGGGHDAPPLVLPPGTYGELRDANGTVLKRVQLSTSTAQPAIPAEVRAGGKPLTVGSTSGSVRWRVYGNGAVHTRGATVVVAIPTADVTSSLQRLVLIEILGGLALLSALGAGSWLIVRHGLRPLEAMADHARGISAGDLSGRVSPADGRSEVGQLGLALNTMLAEIETAFEERDATEQRLRQFLADASHELRTPLTSIRGFAELFRLGADNEHLDRGVIMRRIEEESARMKTLVDDLLLLARLDQTRPARREPVDLAVLAADACSDAVAVAPDRSVTLDAPEPVVVEGDPDHLRQAVANLITNAVRHTPPGSPIEVGASRSDDRAAVLRVRDHGPGLDSEALAHAFDRFWQADRARVGAGAGLGLSIVAAIAGEHGGEADVANDPAGGACFTLRLPLATRSSVAQRRSIAGDGGSVGLGSRSNRSNGAASQPS